MSETSTKYDPLPESHQHIIDSLAGDHPGESEGYADVPVAIVSEQEMESSDAPLFHTLDAEFGALTGLYRTLCRYRNPVRPSENENAELERRFADYQRTFIKCVTEEALLTHVPFVTREVQVADYTASNSSITEIRKLAAVTVRGSIGLAESREHDRAALHSLPKDQTYPLRYEEVFTQREIDKLCEEFKKSNWVFQDMVKAAAEMLKDNRFSQQNGVVSTSPYMTVLGSSHAIDCSEDVDSIATEVVEFILNQTCALVSAEDVESGIKVIAKLLVDVLERFIDMLVDKCEPRSISLAENRLEKRFDVRGYRAYVNAYLGKHLREVIGTLDAMEEAIALFDNMLALRFKELRSRALSIYGTIREIHFCSNSVAALGGKDCVVKILDGVRTRVGSELSVEESAEIVIHLRKEEARRYGAVHKKAANGEDIEKELKSLDEEFRAKREKEESARAEPRNPIPGVHNAFAYLDSGVLPLHRRSEKELWGIAVDADGFFGGAFSLMHAADNQRAALAQGLPRNFFNRSAELYLSSD